MGLDRRLQPIHPAAALDPAHGRQERAFVDYRWHLLVAVEVAPHLVGQPVGRGLADRGDPGADFCQSAGEVSLIVGKARLHEDDVHGGRDLPRWGEWAGRV